MSVCGLDVSAQELVVRVRRQERSEAVRRFANTAAGPENLSSSLLCHSSQRRTQPRSVVGLVVPVTPWAILFRSAGWGGIGKLFLANAGNRIL